MTNGLTQQDSIPLTCTNYVRSINHRLGVSLTGCRSVHFLTDVMIPLKVAVLAYLSGQCWALLCLPCAALVSACGAQRSITHGSSPSWLSVVEPAISQGQCMVGLQQKKHTSRHKESAVRAAVGMGELQRSLPNLWPRACNQVAGAGFDPQTCVL